MKILLNVTYKAEHQQRVCHEPLSSFYLKVNRFVSSFFFFLRRPFNLFLQTRQDAILVRFCDLLPSSSYVQDTEYAHLLLFAFLILRKIQS